MNKTPKLLAPARLCVIQLDKQFFDLPRSIERTMKKLALVGLVGLLGLTSTGCAGVQKMTEQIKLDGTCDAVFLSEKEARELKESSQELEKQADKLFAMGSYELAIQRYVEASAKLLVENELSLEDAAAQSDSVKEFFSANHGLLQRAAEIDFKRGQTYSRLEKNENALHCFSQALKDEIAPPNDAMTYLNRGDAYRDLAKEDLARADYLKSLELFKEYKLPVYVKMADDRLKSVSTPPSK